MPRQTRRNAKAREAASSSDEDAISQTVMNGKGNRAAHCAPEASDLVDKENIFLFWPNQIGTWPVTKLSILRLTHP
jgi:hypothetical protein